MKPQTKIYIGLAVAAIIAVGIIGGAAWSNYKIAKLENAVEIAKQNAEGSMQLAEKREIEAAGYVKKIEYLESQIGEIQKLARKQDEELEKLNVNSVRARNDFEHAKRVRTIAATAAELCAKLTELGHPCSE